MHPRTLESNKRRLLDLGSRLADEVNRMIEAVPEDLEARGSLPHSSTHLADQATDGIDKELILIRHEQEMHEAVRAALGRLDDGSYGYCRACGDEIAPERLEALPYAEHCIACARRDHIAKAAWSRTNQAAFHESHDVALPR